MNIREAVSQDVRIASLGDMLRRAAQLMRDIDAGVLPVGENNCLVGMLTDRDITIRVVAEGKAPDTSRMRDAMSPDILYLFEDESLEDAAHTMGELRARRLAFRPRQAARWHRVAG